MKTLVKLVFEIKSVRNPALSSILLFLYFKSSPNLVLKQIYMNVKYFSLYRLHIHDCLYLIYIFFILTHLYLCQCLWPNSL